jgi:hypothetical protein
VLKKELYSGIPNITVWRVLRKRLHLKAYKLSIIHRSWIVCTPISVNVFVLLATAIFEISLQSFFGNTLYSYEELLVFVVGYDLVKAINVAIFWDIASCSPCANPCL